MSHSILIVEGDPGCRASFVRAVHGAADLTLAGEADDLGAGLRLLAAKRPDVLVAELGVPGGDGIELIRQARRQWPRCEVMVITEFGHEQHVRACIEAGATGYLLKESQGLDLAEQIRVLVGGGSPVSPVIARQLLARMAPASNASGTQATLSPQERTVLQMSSKGYAYGEIAHLLGLSRHTVETYAKRLYRKLQVHGKTEAIFEARKLGWLRD